MSTKHCTRCGHACPDEALFCSQCGSALHRSTQDPLIGQTVAGRYHLIERIGQGGAGTLYRAEHVTLRRRMALKLLHHQLSVNEEAVERFRREAITVCEIDNDHILQVHDFGKSDDGRLFFAMEYLEGEPLSALLEREGRLPIERTCDIMGQIADALMEAHALGYVHRDLRPRNVFLTKRRGRADFVKLLDFGLAKLILPDVDAAKTNMGMTFGDPHYMAPEQARGEVVDRRADLYSLGALGYEMLVGQPPYKGAGTFDVLGKVLDAAVPRICDKRADCPEWLEAVVRVALAKSPVDRFATVAQFLEALERKQVLERQPPFGLQVTPQSERMKAIDQMAPMRAPAIQAAATAPVLAAAGAVAVPARNVTRAYEPVKMEVLQEAPVREGQGTGGQRLSKRERRQQEHERKSAGLAARETSAEKDRRERESAARESADKAAKEATAAEAQQRAEQETRRRAEEEARQALAKEEARRRAEEETRRRAEEAKEEAQRKSEEAQRRAEHAKEEARRQAQERADQEALLRQKQAEQETQKKAEQEARRRAQEAERKQTEEVQAARLAAEQETKRAEEAARQKAEREAQKKIEQEARHRREAQRKVESEIENQSRTASGRAKEAAARIMRTARDRQQASQDEPALREIPHEATAPMQQAQGYTPEAIAKEAAAWEEAAQQILNAPAVETQNRRLTGENRRIIVEEATMGRPIAVEALSESARPDDTTRPVPMALAIDIAKRSEAPFIDESKESPERLAVQTPVEVVADESPQDQGGQGRATGEHENLWFDTAVPAVAAVAPVYLDDEQPLRRRLPVLIGSAVAGVLMLAIVVVVVATQFHHTSGEATTLPGEPGQQAKPKDPVTQPVVQSKPEVQAGPLEVVPQPPKETPPQPVKVAPPVVAQPVKEVPIKEVVAPSVAKEKPTPPPTKEKVAAPVPPVRSANKPAARPVATKDPKRSVAPAKEKEKERSNDAEPSDKKPGEGAAFLVQLGRQRLQSGDVGAAGSSFAKAHEIDPKSAEALAGLGEVAFEQGNWDDAIRNLRQAIRLSPRKTSYQVLLGQSLYKLGRYKDAADVCSKALKQDPSLREAQQTLDLAQKKLSDSSDSL